MWGMIAVAALGTAKYLYDQQQAGKRLSDREQMFLNSINELDVNNPEEWYAKYKHYADPILYENYQLQGTEYDNIQADPSVLYAQNKALDELMNLSDSKGLDAIDQQALQEIMTDENRNLQGQNQAIAQDAMQRGVYGSGLEMAQRLQNAQSSANRANSKDMEVMAQAQQRALDALSSYGNLASDMRTQGFNEQAKRAEAQDAINLANFQNTQSNANANVDLQNKTNMANVDIDNAQEDQRAQTERDLWDTRYKKSELISGRVNEQEKADAEREKAKNGLTGSLMQAGATYFS